MGGGQLFLECLDLATGESLLLKELLLQERQLGSQLFGFVLQHCLVTLILLQERLDLHVLDLQETAEFINLAIDHPVLAVVCLFQGHELLLVEVRKILRKALDLTTI